MGVERLLHKLFDIISIYADRPWMLGESVTRMIKKAVKDAKDIDLAEFLADVYLSENIINVIKECTSYMFRENIVETVGYVASYTKDGDAAVKVADTIKVYANEPLIGMEILEIIGYLAMQLRSAEAIVKVADAIKAYANEPEVGRQIAREIKNVVEYTNDIKATMKAAEAISMYADEPQTGRWVADLLGIAASYTRNAETVAKMSNIIMNRELMNYIARSNISGYYIIDHINLLEEFGLEGIKRIEKGYHTGKDPLSINLSDFSPKK